MNYQYATARGQILNSQNIQFAASLFVSLIGMGITLFGLKYTLDVFLLLYKAIGNPESLIQVIDQWSKVLQLKSSTISLGGTDYPADTLIILLILGIGALLLIKITLSITHTGTRILLQSINSSKTIAARKLTFNADYKLNQLKTLAEQGKISTKAYEDARDNYLVRNIMED